MAFRELVEQVRPGGGGQVFGEPYETSDGSTIVTVSRVRGGTKSGGVGGYTATPVGVFVVHDGSVTWKAADDTTRTALFGEFIGLVTGVILMLTLLRRPPWPDLSARVMTAFSGTSRSPLDLAVRRRTPVR